ncbi:MAG: hypothetical protein PHI65_08140, partial [Firmicutes bacterium]|nr:hypothetical protein [Bacillota bacterium]
MTETRPPKKKISVFNAFRRLVPVIYGATPIFFLVYTVISISHGLLWGVETMMQQRFFDTATLFAIGKNQFSTVLRALAFLGGANIFCQILNGVANYLPDMFAQKVIGRLTAGINKKMAKLDPIVFENTDKLDDINKAEQGKNNSIWFMFIFTTIFTFYLPYFLFMGWYLFTLKPILVLSIVIIFVPTLLTQIIRTKVFTKLEDKLAPKRREYDYYESCMVSREYFKETRLLGGFLYFKKLYLESLEALQLLRFKATMKTNLIELLMRLLTVIGFFTIFLMLFNALMKREITVGAFAAVTNSVGLLYSIMEEVVCRHIGHMAESM